MIKLVTNNVNKPIKDELSKNNKTVKTCKANCVLFNHGYNTCPIFKGLNYEDPNIVKRCLEFTDIAKTEELYTESSNVLENEYHVQNTSETGIDDDFLFELIGDEGAEEYSDYPKVPELDFAESMKGIHWYVSPDESFGCWIKNNSRKQFGVIPVDRESAVSGWADNIYRSPIPLHDHGASESLKSRMCWFVDEDGWGQYTLILANKIKFLTYPKPPFYGK